MCNNRHVTSVAASNQQKRHDSSLSQIPLRFTCGSFRARYSTFQTISRPLTECYLDRVKGYRDVRRSA